MKTLRPKGTHSKNRALTEVAGSAQVDTGERSFLLIFPASLPPPVFPGRVAILNEICLGLPRAWPGSAAEKRPGIQL